MQAMASEQKGVGHSGRAAPAVIRTRRLFAGDALHQELVAHVPCKLAGEVLRGGVLNHRPCHCPLAPILVPGGVLRLEAGLFQTLLQDLVNAHGVGLALVPAA